MLARPALLIPLALAATSCLDVPVAAEGQFGRAIPLARKDDAAVPRLAFRREACPGESGGCTEFCQQRPEDCLQDNPDACMPIVIDSGSPFTVLPNTTQSYAVQRECFEVRSAAGLGAGASAEDLAAAVSRFRFVDPPVVDAPGDEVSGWTWDIGSDLASSRVGAVLGGNTLRHFAVSFRSAPDEEGSVAFFRAFPGDELALADQGRAYVRLQFPGRLLGRQVDDKCDVGGIDCELDGIDIRPDDEQLVYDSTRMMVDACLAPPPCAPLFESDPDDVAAEPECRLRAGGTFRTDTDGEVVGCLPPTDEDRGGKSASLLVATGVPDLVLFEDSTTRMFGPLDDLPECTAPVDLSARACRVDGNGFLFAPGWPAQTGLRRIKVRALSLVPGSTAVSTASPCTRLERRLTGLQAQCIQYAATAQPRDPALSGEFEDGTVDYGFASFGEAHWVGEQDAPDRDRWIDTLVVPETSPMVLALRRDVGSDALEPDGMIGSVMLRDTETVLDYTEDDDRPGVRITCLDPGSGTCMSVTACSPVDSDAAVETGVGRPGRLSCCYGLPQSLIGRVIREGADKEPPRVEEACCAALHPDALAALKAEDAGLCAQVDPL